MGLLGNLAWLVALVCAVWVIFEVATKHKHWKTGRKVVWIVCALLFNIITAIVYYFVEHKKK